MYSPSASAVDIKFTRTMPPTLPQPRCTVRVRAKKDALARARVRASSCVCVVSSIAANAGEWPSARHTQTGRA